MNNNRRIYELAINRLNPDSPSYDQDRQDLEDQMYADEAEHFEDCDVSLETWQGPEEVKFWEAEQLPLPLFSDFSDSGGNDGPPVDHDMVDIPLPGREQDEMDRQRDYARENGKMMAAIMNRKFHRQS